MAKHLPKLALLLIALILPVTLLAVQNQQEQRSNAQSASFTFTAAGDFGFKAESKASMDTVAKSGSQFFIALGDMMYTSGGEQEWCTTFKSKLKDIEIIAGNHDVGESGGGNIDQFIKYCPFTLGTLQGTYGKEYYFDYPQTGTPLARFIMISPGLKGSMNTKYNSGSASYTFTQQAIDDAKSKNIKWVIVGMHKNCITAGTKSCEVGEDIMNLLIQKKVDLILQGHDHIYHRSHALGCMKVGAYDSTCVADNGDDGKYEKGKGPVIIINGEAGQSLYKIDQSDSEFAYFAKFDDTTFGVTKYTITDTQLSAQYLRSAGGNFADTFTISAGASTQPSTNPTFPQPTDVTPTLFCLGGVPCYTPAPTNGTTTTPPVGGTNPTTDPNVTGTTNPSPMVSPCESNDSSIQHKKKHKKHTRGGNGGWLSKFFDFLIKLIMMLFGMPVPPTPVDPNPVPTPSPGEPTPCPEPTTGEQPTTPVEPTVQPTDVQPSTQPSTQPSVTTAPGTTQTKRNIPIAPDGSLGQFNLSSKNYIMAFRFVLDTPATIDRWYYAINAEGASCVGGRTGYGAGNGGTEFGRIVEVDQATGFPTGTILAQESVNGCTAHNRSISEFGLSKTHQAHFVQFSPVTLQAGKMYAFLLSNTDPNPGSGGSASSGNHTSPNLNFAKLSDMGPHAKNTLDPNAPGALYGYDPRETTMWSKDGGKSWLFGSQVGWYQVGSDRGRMWVVGYRAGGKNIPHGYTYMNWPGSSSGASITYKNVPKAVTLTSAGGASGSSVGVVTVTNTSTGVSATTPSLGGGVPTGQLSKPVPVAAGESYTIKASGSVETGSASFWDKIFGLGSNYTSSCSACSKSSDMPALFALPHPY